MPTCGRVEYGWARVLPASALLRCVLAPFACSKEKPPPAIVEETYAATANDAGTSFTSQPLGCGDAGTQSTIAVSGTTVGVASLAQTASTQTCTIKPLGPVMTSQVQLWNVCYAQSNGDGTDSSQVVGTPTWYVGPTGFGSAFDSSGNPAIAFTGVGSTAAAERCGANDLFLATSTGGTFGTPVHILHGSEEWARRGASGQLPRERVQHGRRDGLVAKPRLRLAGLPDDGLSRCALRIRRRRFRRVGRRARAVFELRPGAHRSNVSRGGGTYNRLAFTPSGLPAHPPVQRHGRRAGRLHRFRTHSAAASPPKRPTAAGRRAACRAGRSASSSASPSARRACSRPRTTMRRRPPSSTRPRLTERPGRARRRFTNAFDGPSSKPRLRSERDNPAIAYYRCSATAGTTSCDSATDGLYLARLVGGTWTPPRSSTRTPPRTTASIRRWRSCRERPSSRSRSS